MARVTVISPYFNRQDLVDRTVESIARQTYKDFEAIFIDDASSDQTHEALLRHVGGPIQVVRQANQGFTRTMIAAIARSDSDYIALQGSGDVAHPERLAMQAEYLDKHPGVVLVGCHRELEVENGDNSRLAPIVEPDVIAQLHRENPFSHGEVMFRRSAYLAAGGYRPFFTYRQDLDLWLRMAAQGEFFVIPRVLYRRYHLQDSVTGKIDKMILAMACRDFAVHCSVERLAGRPDPLDRHGPAGALTRPRSRLLAQQFAEAARLRALAGLAADARALAVAALSEKLTMSGLASYGMAIASPQLIALRRLVRKIKAGLKPVPTAEPASGQRKT